MNRLRSTAVTAPGFLQNRVAAYAPSGTTGHPRQTPSAPEFADGEPLVHAHDGQRWFPGFPARLDRLVVISDLTPASQPALEFALRRVGCFPVHLTLVHARGTAQAGAAGASDEQDHARLLCLFWEIRLRHPDASVCMALHRRPEQILAAAAAVQADLIVLPQAILPAFTHVILRARSGDRIQGSPCPAIVVDSTSRLPRHP